MAESKDLSKMVECHYKGAVVYVPVQLFTSMTMRMKSQSSKFIRYKDGPEMYGMSLSNFKKLVNDADAVYRPSKKVALINVEKLDKYLEYFRDNA